MTKVAKFSSLAVLAVVLCGIYKTASITMAASADYSRADWLTFYLIAPSEVKHAPLINDSTPIHFRAADGASPQIDEIEYARDTDENILSEYLRALGYRQEKDPVFGTRWSLQGTDKSAYIAATENSIRLTFAD